MQTSFDTGWLDIGLLENSSFAVHDKGRLQHLIGELPDKGNQYPYLCCFLGGHDSNHALQQLYPLNNIKRHASEARIKLRCDIGSLESHQPVLIANGDIPTMEDIHQIGTLKAAQGLAVSWEPHSAGRMLIAMWSRLVFPFADVVCLFVDDPASFEKTVLFLIACLQMSSDASYPWHYLPKVVLVYGPRVANEAKIDTAHIDRRLREIGHKDLSHLFSSVASVYLSDDVSETARFQRIKAEVMSQSATSTSTRTNHHARPNGTHLAELFKLALRHFSQSIVKAFDVVKGTRKSRPVTHDLKLNIAHYLKIGSHAHVQLSQLAPSVASALFMDHYVPGMFAANPHAVFQTLYKETVFEGYLRTQALWPKSCPGEQTTLVESHFINLFESFSGYSGDPRPSADLRREQLVSHSGILSSLRSNRICLYCISHSAQHVLACGHTVCDRCAQVFGIPSKGLEYQFTIKGCLCCLYQRPLIVNVVPPTASPTILAVDGGGVRGVIPLEFLVLVQEHLRPCTIQDVVDLALGTSSGGLIVLGLFAMSWSVAHCSERFDTLARRIFREKRTSTIPLFLCQMAGYNSPLGNIIDWIHWFLRDSCYDSRVFDTALESAFGADRQLFGSSRGDPPGPRRSGPRVGVVTTSISKDTSSFVAGNFNVSQDSSGEYDYEIIRPGNVRYEPTLCKVARATAAAPGFFTPADLQGIGSFQDGGLKYNFAGEIASQVGYQIWPRAMGSIRMLSLGTGKAQSTEQTPHFRNIFRDSFLRRGFDAWMSTMDTDKDWKKWKGRLKDTVKEDCHRLDVSLGSSPHSLDAIENMEDYRNLVMLQVGSARMAKEAATTLLTSCFFFWVDFLPLDTTIPFWCYGSVRCKGPARKVILALETLYPEGLRFTSDRGPIDDFGGLGSLCVSCGRYSRSISFLTHHLDDTVNIYIQSHSKKRWRIGGFPDSVGSFASRQGLDSSFGHGHHGCPFRGPCHSCDVSETVLRGKRRRRETRNSTDGSARKRMMC